MRSIYFSARKRETAKTWYPHPVAPSQSVPRPILIIRLNQIIIEKPQSLRGNPSEYANICNMARVSVHIAAYNTTIHRQLLFSFFAHITFMTFPISSVCAVTISPWKPVNQTIEFWPIEHISNVHQSRKTRLSLCVAWRIFVDRLLQLCCLMQISTQFFL